MKRGAKLIVLLAVLVLLAGLTVAVQNTDFDREEEAETVYLLELDASSVTELSWQAGDMTLTFARTADGWSLPADAAFPVRTSAVESLLADLSGAVAAKTISHVTDLGEYGLDVPSCVIRITDGETRTISVGSETAMGGSYYITMDGQTVILVDSDALLGFDSVPWDFLQTESIPYMGTVTDVRVERTRDTLEIHLETADSGTVWHGVVNGEEFALDPTLTAAFVETAGGIYWDTCVAYNADAAALKAYGLDEPAAVLTVTYTRTSYVETELTDDNGQTITEAVTDAYTFVLEIGDETETGAYARLAGSSMVYEISDSFSDELLYLTINDLLPAEDTGE